MNIPQYITQLTRQWIRDVSKRLTAGNCILVKEDENNRIVEVDVDALKLQIGDAGGEGVVRTTGNQTITGVKTFKGNEMIVLDSNGQTFSRFKFVNGNVTLGYVGSYDHVSTGLFNSKASVIWGGGQNGDAICLLVGQHDDYGVGVYMTVSPTDSESTSLNKIPTMGWVNDKFSRKSHTHGSDYASKSHNHDGDYASRSHNHDGDYASRNHNHDGDYADATHQHVSADITDLEVTIDGKITAFSNTASGTYATKTELSTATEGLVTAEEFGELEAWADEIDADLYDDNGNKKYVGTTGNQTITGVKTFKGNEMIVLDSNGATFSRFKFVNGNVTLGYVGSYDHVSTGVFASKATVIWGGGANGDAQCLLVGEHDTDGVGVYMRNAPTDSQSTGLNKVPTMGWTNSYFVRKSTVGTSNGPAAYSHAHGNITSTGVISGSNKANKVVVTDASGAIGCGTATTGDLQAVCSAVTASSASGTYYASKLTAKANSSSAGVELDGPNKAVRLGTSTTQCTISESSGGLTLNGATSAKLKGGSTVTLDAPANGASLTNSPTDAASDTSSLHVATCGWAASKFKSKDAEAQEQTIDVVTNVVWNGTSLLFKKRTLTIKDGEITDIGEESTNNPPIDTPVVIQWS